MGEKMDGSNSFTIEIPKRKKDILKQMAEPLRGRLIDEPLTPEDWREVFWFWQTVVRPFLWRIVGRARLREQK